MTCTPTDFFMRRTGRLFFDKPSVDSYKSLVSEIFASAFNWDEKTTKKHLQELEDKLKMATTFE